MQSVKTLTLDESSSAATSAFCAAAMADNSEIAFLTL
jgi:hypothetical protein